MVVESYRAFRIHGGGGTADTFSAGVETVTYTPPDKNEVVIRVHWSGINYKDALAGTDAVPVVRIDELTGGIDLAGEIVEAGDDVPDAFSIGTHVIVNGCGLSEDHDGGYAEYARIPADWLVPVGELDTKRAMLIGTAGFTAALALHVMHRNGQTPEMGPIAVTGASGGVGSFAINLLSRLGYECVAVTRSAHSSDTEKYLRALGASRVIEIPEVNSALLKRVEWGGAIDSLGGDALMTLLKATRPWGNVVSVGLAQSPTLTTSVMPFIVRGVNLLGVTSANCPISLRRELWKLLGKEWLPDCFESVHAGTVTLDTLQASFERILKGEVRGRLLVDTQAK